MDHIIKPQTPQEIIKQAKQSGKSVKETKELIQKHKELQEHNNTEANTPIDNKQTNKELESKQDLNEKIDGITKQKLDEIKTLIEAEEAYDKLVSIKYGKELRQKHEQKLKEADFDFENPFSFHNINKSRYKESWGSVDIQKNKKI